MGDRDKDKWREKRDFRKVTGPKRTKKHQRILSLECIDEVDNMLINGYSLREVARFVQRERAECTDINEASLVTTLSRYKNDIPAERFQPDAPIGGTVIEGTKTGEKFDELRELERLYNLQMGRLEKFSRNEGRVPNAAMSKEVGTATSILKEMYNIKSELGLTGEKNLGTVNIRHDIQQKIASYGVQVKEVLEDPKSSGRVLSIVQMIAKRKEELPDDMAELGEGE